MQVDAMVSLQVAEKVFVKDNRKADY
jgi:hypothetical protein